ncbi:MAG: amidohydrolase [Tissierellia bacterium]|nr:amidohydrolase [Tissierellia bacterium]
MIVIKNATIMPMTSETINNGQIEIENGKISYVGIARDVDQVERTIDARGSLVTPGLIDAHCHIGLFEEGIGFEGDDGNEMTDPITPNMRGIDGINPHDEAFELARAGGVTTAITGPGSANVVGGTFLAIKTVGNRVDDMVLKDPIAMKIAFGENPKRVYNGRKQTPMTRMGTAALLREALNKAKEYDGKMSLEDESKHPGFDAKLEALRPVVRGELPLKAHAHRADDIFTAIRIADEFGIPITLDHCTEGHLIADHLGKIGKPAIVGPTFGNKSKFELNKKTFKTPKALVEAGVKIAINTDSPVIPLENLPLCAALAVKEGLDETEAWKSITINPAEICGISDRVGSLEVGKDADIVVFSGDPMHDVDYRVKYTIIDGVIVYEGKQ